MNTEKYRQLAIDIAELLGAGYTSPNGRIEAYEPAEFQAGMELAFAMYLVAQFPKELEEVLQLHAKSLRYFVEEVDAKQHRDDSLDISGFTL